MRLKSVSDIYSGIGIGRNQADTSRYFHLNNVETNIGKSHSMHVNYNFQAFQCLCTLFKDSYIYIVR